LIKNTFTRSHKILQFQTINKGSQWPCNLLLQLLSLPEIKMVFILFYIRQYLLSRSLSILCPAGRSG
jgi:hypothetical protein